MVHTCKSVPSVRKFLMALASNLNFMYDTVLIANDVDVDLKFSFKSWVECACPGRFEIYVRKHGTFNSFTSMLEEQKKYWKHELVGKIIITKSEFYNIEWKNIN